MNRRLTLRWEGAPLELEIDFHPPLMSITRDGRRIEGEIKRDGDWMEIRQGSHVTSCTAIAGPRGVWVGLNGRAYFLERSHREREAQAGAVSTNEIRAPMTGRVVGVAIGPGGNALEGDLLLTIEAMKMEFRLTAPADGTVAELFCAEGDRVELGQLLVRLEPRGAA